VTFLSTQVHQPCIQKNERFFEIIIDRFIKIPEAAIAAAQQARNRNILALFSFACPYQIDHIGSIHSPVILFLEWPRDSDIARKRYRLVVNCSGRSKMPPAVPASLVGIHKICGDLTQQNSNDSHVPVKA
jgi:hypothetical protein